MAFQSENNFNIHNKLIKIDGEYVKLYVTTNNTLPKLLKNTGSLIVYHEGIEQNKKNNTALNYLYLANNLIASGWGFHTKTERDDAEFFFNYGNDYNNSHIGENDPQYRHHYYNIIDKLYDTLSFWDALRTSGSAIDDSFKLITTDVVDHYDLYLENERNLKDDDKPTFYSLYKDSNVFSSINDIIYRVCANNEIKYEQYVPFNKSLTNTSKYAPFAMQYLNKDMLNTQFPESTIVYHYDDVISKRKIFLDMIPYMLGPAIYIKPQVIDFDVEVTYQYRSFGLTSINRDSDNVTKRYVAKKVNGKYQIPKGANIKDITMKFIVKMNDAKSLYDLEYQYAVTKYENHLHNIHKDDSTDSFSVFTKSSLLLNHNKNEFNEIKGQIIDNINNGFKSFTTKYKTANIRFSSASNTKYGDEYVEYSVVFDYGDNLSIVYEDTTLVQGIKLGYSGIKELKQYTGFTNPFFDDPTKTEYDENNNQIGASALNCLIDRNNNLIIDHQQKTYNTLYSFEYAWTTEYLDLSESIKIEALDVIYTTLIPQNFHYEVTNDSIIYVPVDSSSHAPVDFAFSTNDIFCDYRNISSINENRSTKTLSKPIVYSGNDVDIETYKQGFDLLIVSVPKDKSIKSIYANIEYQNQLKGTQTQRKLIQKENITGLLKFVSHKNYFISLNPEMTNTSVDSNTVQRSSCVTELNTNMLAQPYVIYFAMIPRTYVQENMQNGIISFDITLDNEPEYNAYYPFIQYKFQNVDNIFGLSLNNEITSSNNILDNTTTNKIKVAEILSELNDSTMISDTDYDSTHIFNLSWNVYTPKTKYGLDDIIATKLQNIEQINPIMMFSRTNIEKVVQQYCKKLNFMSL